MSLNSCLVVFSNISNGQVISPVPGGTTSTFSVVVPSTSSITIGTYKMTIERCFMKKSEKIARIF